MPGACGAGPNVSLHPPGVTFSHVTSPARLAQVLTQAVPGLVVDQLLIKCTQLRLAGNAAAAEGRLEDAVAAYTEVVGIASAHTPYLRLPAFLSRSLPHPSNS